MSKTLRPERAIVVLGAQALFVRILQGGNEGERLLCGMIYIDCPCQSVARRFVEAFYRAPLVGEAGPAHVRQHARADQFTKLSACVYGCISVSRNLRATRGACILGCASMSRPGQGHQAR